MQNKKARHIICTIVIITLLAGQTLFSFGDENQSIQQYAASTTEGAINETVPSNPPSSGGNGDATDTNKDNGSNKEISIEAQNSSDGNSLENELSIIEQKTDDVVNGAEFNGYIVEIKENKVDEIIEEEKEKVIETEIKEDLVVVENPEDIVSFVSASAIENISPNYVVSAFAYPENTNDTYYSSQWWIPQANINSIWKTGKTGAGINVAIIDSGLNLSHQDIDETKVKGALNFTDLNNPSSTDISDGAGHGTFVTGIIAAKTNNAFGLAGITDQVNIYSYKVLGADGKGDVANIIKAYTALLNSGVTIDVLNLSLGHEGSIPAENDLIQQFISRGTIVVAAVGNDGTKGSPLSYPANYSGVIGVGSIDSNGAISNFSSRNSSVDVSAPGGGMTGLSKSGSGTQPGSGTSFACPVVASVAVAVKQMNRSINSIEFLNLLKSSVIDNGPAGWDSSYGYGVLSVNSLINSLYGNYGTVYFDANGGYGVYTTKTVVTGSNYGALPATSRSGYVFAGWFTAPAGGYYVDASSIMNSTGAVTLYAQWSKLFTVSFNANGGKKVSTKKSVPVGWQYGSMPSSSRSKYGFLGWYTKKTGGTKVTASSYMWTSANTTLYAHWGKKYTVKFNPNKGKVKTKSKSVTKGATYGSLPTPTRAKYTFVGWYTKKSGGTMITSTKAAKMNGTQTLYARWKKA